MTYWFFFLNPDWDLLNSLNIHMNINIDWVLFDAFHWKWGVNRLDYFLRDLSVDGQFELDVSLLGFWDVNLELPNIRP